MPGEGSLYKVIVGNELVSYFPATEDAIVIEAPDGTRTTVVSSGGGIAPSVMNGVTLPVEVTGARDDGTALAALLTALESLGLITDSTTAT